MIHYMVEGEETYSPRTDQAKKIKKLERENKKLKECLKWYMGEYETPELVSKCLKELEAGE